MYASRSVVRAPVRASVTSRRCRGSMRRTQHSVAVVQCAVSREDEAAASVARVGGVHANLARAVVVGALMMTTAGAGADAARADGDVELNVEALYAAATTTSAASEAAVRDTSSTYTVNWKDLLDAPEVTASGSKKAKASKGASAPVRAPAPAPAVVKAQEKKEQEMRQVNLAKSQREEYAAAQRAEKNAAKKARDEAVMAKVEARRAEQRAVLAERERQAAEDLAKFQAERAEQRARMDALAAVKRSTSPAMTAPVPKTKKPAALTKSAAAKKSTAKASPATKKKTNTVAKAAKKSAPVYKQRKSKPAKKRTNTGAIDRYSLRNTRKQRGGSPLALPGFIALAGFTYYLLLQEEED